ncbi:hypothetical protein SAMN05216464_111245 [Mucilaginibacter pineti]|uniref:Uncharacterized protein n=1 Tax=Mucilaginibacter pineti TaxID=1391627 RepID=A0A1G7HJU0_9SPHI|nr:hypothetical protein [Mucilaginibacter pineti]SDF00269.1 hypothetical protein SAMN05216464_111245 [Mucilaginibacter pineti]
MALIKLAYKQIIDASAQGEFEKRVFHASYQEFLLKMQTYNPDRKFKTFTELKAHDGRANSLHYKLSFAVGHFFEMLNGRIPELKDNLGNQLKFEIPQFELMESDIDDRSAHKLAIIYTTGTLNLLNQLAEFMILADGDATDKAAQDTFIVKMQSNLSIISYQADEEPAILALNGRQYN